MIWGYHYFRNHPFAALLWREDSPASDFPGVPVLQGPSGTPEPVHPQKWSEDQVRESLMHTLPKFNMEPENDTLE